MNGGLGNSREGCQAASPPIVALLPFSEAFRSSDFYAEVFVLQWQKNIQGPGRQ
jgi:hypothetical protein